MDQSASVFSERGSALFVSFTPTLKARPVQFPETDPALVFLIAQSFVTSDKFVTGPIHYNLRVVECTLAAAYLNATLNPPGTPLPTDAAPLGISLHGFQETYFALQEQAGHPPKSAPEQLQELLTLTSQTLTKPEGYTREEIAAVLGLEVSVLDARFTSRFPVRAERFKLAQRAQHVFSEALRVVQFLSLLESGTSLSTSTTPSPSTDIGTQLGALLNATQTSCRDTYECSCDEIDTLCALARDAGAYGSRLTGAGWGGCSVHLVPADRVPAVRAAWERGYYGKLDGLTEEQREAAVVVSRPGGGAAVLRVVGGEVLG